MRMGFGWARAGAAARRGGGEQGSTGELHGGLPGGFGGRVVGEGMWRQGLQRCATSPGVEGGGDAGVAAEADAVAAGGWGGQAVVGEAGEEAGEGDLAFEAGEAHAGALVDAGAEGEVAVGAAGDVEAVRVGEAAGVAVGGADADGDEGAGGDGAGRRWWWGAVVHAVAELVAAFEAEDLLDGGAGEAGVGDQAGASRRGGRGG